VRETIVFDLDGTLSTCENKQKFALFSILNRSSPPSLNDINIWWDLKRNGSNSENSLTKIGISNAKDIASEWIAIIENSQWCALDTPFDDSLSTLEFLKQSHYKIIILTARKCRLTLIQSIFRFGFSSIIDDLIIVNPKNTIIEKSRYLSQIKPLIYIGDSELDFQASVESEIFFTALNRGQRSALFLKENGVKHIENNLIFLQNSDKIS